MLCGHGKDTMQATTDGWQQWVYQTPPHTCLPLQIDGISGIV